jgi:hypothetical protein
MLIIQPFVFPDMVESTKVFRREMNFSESLLFWLTLTLVMYGAYPLIRDGIFGIIYALIVILIAAIFTGYAMKGKPIPIPMIKIGKEE